MLVVDASVAIKWFKDEHDSEVARLVLVVDILTAPELLVAEVCNVGWKALRRGLMKPEQVDEVASEVRGLFSVLYPLAALAPRAVAIARKLDHPVYDCFYLALVEREQAPLVSADRRLLARLAGTSWSGLVRDLASFAPRRP